MDQQQKPKTKISRSFLAICVLFFLAFLYLILILWPKYKDSHINSFSECKAAGYAVQESYPEACMTKGGKRYVNLEQLNYMSIPEWNIRLYVVNRAKDLRYTATDKDSKILLTFKELDDFAQQNKGCSFANQQKYIFRTKDQQTAGKASTLINGYYYYSKKSDISPCAGTDIARITELNNKAYELQSKIPTYQDVQQMPGL